MSKLIATSRFKRFYSGNARVSAVAGALRVGRAEIQERHAFEELQKVLTLIREGETLARQLTSSVAQIVERTPIRPYDPVQERLRQRAATAILNGTEWLTSTEVDALVPGSGKRINSHARANRLLSEGKVFAIEHGGKKRYPRYAFDPLGNPYPAIRDVLQLFGKASPLRVASWFESSSVALNGRRPREVLEADPTAVVLAAREHIAGPVHG
ncbi:hypothetical protein JOD97_001020 [Duganella sp. 1411]|jgi:hypothetical protein|uniref:hypothetical protein n=1 Tax=Duganella sp. 1411 TaxID=2806572 RepID=UPI001AEA56C4|nr:hypothetical protein [Duganella sp. 1411]MBP1203006.1 hypothetical protein [Duganella sp. 1411]